jgi:hypothetical protein
MWEVAGIQESTEDTGRTIKTEKKRRRPSKCASERSLLSFKAGGKTPFEIIADFNRQEDDKLEFFNRPNKEKAHEILIRSRKVRKGLKSSLHNTFAKEATKIRKLETSLSSDVLSAYVTSDPIYKELAT